MITEYLRVPFDPPTLPPGVHPCSDCLGQGVTDETYTMPASDGLVLLLAVFCPGCDGCGAAGHTSCPPGVHALDDVRGGDCSSCGGRGWSAVAGWSATPGSPAVLMRVPCACQEGRVVRVSPEGVGVHG